MIGPGLGRGDDIGAEVRHVLSLCKVPAVIDGDGIACAVDPNGGYEALQARQRPPSSPHHDGEFGTLGGDATHPDRIEATRQLAAGTGCVVLRKGPTTVISDVDGAVYLVVSGDERLATAGSGDVLSGIIGAYWHAASRLTKQPLPAPLFTVWQVRRVLLREPLRATLLQQFQM